MDSELKVKRYNFFKKKATDSQAKDKSKKKLPIR